ncbi:glycosyltransferase [Nostoc sp. NIES-2111]
MNERPKPRQACIDRSFYFANRILVEGWSLPAFDRAEVEVDLQGTAHLLPVEGLARVERPDVVASLRPAANGPADQRFGFVASLDRTRIPGFAPDGETRWRLLVDGQEVAAFAGAGITVGHIGGEMNAEAVLCVGHATAAGIVSAAAARLFHAAMSGFDGLPRLEAQVDAVARGGHGLACDGWIANARQRQIAFLSGDGAGFAGPGDALFFPRPDVTQHLRRIGHPVTTEDHGAIAVFSCAGANARHIIAGSFDGGRLTGYFTAGAEANADVAGLFARINAVEGGGRFVAPEAADRLYRPFMHEPRKEPAWTVIDVKPLAVRPDLSIIVPFYKEDMFIRHLTTMQMWFSETVEWIFVCDDPSLRRNLETYLRRRAPLLRNRTRLVINHENYGYGPSNNIAASLAEGDYLLFMNSDIWVDDAGPLERAVAALDSGEFGAIGFRLLYEDGTIQHDGLVFQTHPDVHDLYLVEHPGKGLPPRKAIPGEIARAPAATGALLMVGRELFNRVGGFDEIYVRGDFEDADLCLRIAELGLPTGIVREPGIYHLERQSIRMMGEVSFREVVMYLNCITFNRRWKTALDDTAAGVPADRKSPAIDYPAAAE